MTAVDAASPARRCRGRGPTSESLARSRLRWWHEVLYIVLVYVAYSAVRNQFGSGAGTEIDADPAFHHAEAIIQIERNIGLYFEDRLQQWYLDLPLDGSSGSGTSTTGSCTSWWPPRPRVAVPEAPWRYRLWRNTLAFTTLLALIGFATFSLMPPRLLDDPGIYGGCRSTPPGSDLPARRASRRATSSGTSTPWPSTAGWASFGSEEMAAVSNQYAAMPSMHIGWSTWCALVLAPLVRRRWLKALVIAYPLVTLFDIMVTGNHYWIDGLGGLVCLGRRLRARPRCHHVVGGLPAARRSSPGRRRPRTS